MINFYHQTISNIDPWIEPKGAYRFMNSKESTGAVSARARRITTSDLVLAGMVAAVLTIISQISIPMPTGVPITIQVFGITLVSVILGWRLGLFGTLVYILLGVIGLPIFANFSGGFSSLVNFTGGYIWSWPLMSILCGLHVKTANKHINALLLFLLPLAGLAVNEFFGGLQWAFLAGNMTYKGVFIYSITAFVPKDIVLTILAVILGTQMRRLFLRAGLLTQ